MTPTELFQEARLGEAIAAQREVLRAQSVRAQSDNIAERLLLCDLLAFTGDRNLVRRELDRLPTLPPELSAYLAEWLDLLTADDARHAGRTPQWFVEPSLHVAHRLQAVERLRQGDAEAALDLLDAADEAAPWVGGHVDGREFEGWRDADDLLGPVLELIHGDNIVWLPVDCVRKLRLEEASSLRDSLYRPATVWLNNGSEREVFLPALYVGTADHAEDGIRTGAGVDWIENGGLMRGLGAREFLFGEEELTLDEFRQVEVRRVIGD
jgi:type VI secretion system protein ImpE